MDFVERNHLLTKSRYLILVVMLKGFDVPCKQLGHLDFQQLHLLKVGFRLLLKFGLELGYEFIKKVDLVLRGLAELVQLLVEFVYLSCLLAADVVDFLVLGLQSLH